MDSTREEKHDPDKGDLPLQWGQAGSLLSNRPFRRLWIAQFAATAAVYSLSLAAIVHVADQTQSSVQTAVVILSAILPAFLGSLVAGPIVDRFGRARSLRFSHLARAFVALGFWAAAWLLPADKILLAFFATNAALALFTQFATPAELAMLPDLVDRKHLVPANALLQISWLIAEGLGILILSPLVIKLAGVPAVGLVGMGLCLVATALVMPLPRDETGTLRGEDQGIDWIGLAADLQAGWRAIVRDRLLVLVVLQATLAATLLLILVSLLPGLASRSLGLGSEDAVFLLLPGGLGFALGAAAVSRWAEWMSRPNWIALGLIGFGVGTGLLGIVMDEPDSLPLVLVLILAMGACLALVIISARTILQERPPASIRGRVIAAQLALANAAAVIPLLVGGALADHVGFGPVMVSMGLLAIGAGLVGLYITKGKGAGPIDRERAQVPPE